MSLSYSQKLNANHKAIAAGVDDLSQFVDRHLKKINDLNYIYFPIEAGEFVEFILRIETKKRKAIKIDVGERAFVRGVKNGFAWVYVQGRKNAVKVPISILKRWSNGKK